MVDHSFYNIYNSTALKTETFIYMNVFTMYRMMHLLKKWKRKKQLKKETGWHHIKDEDVPGWVELRYLNQWGRQQLYGTTMRIKGKHYRYKIVTGWPKFQGDSPRTYYRRKRTWFAIEQLKRRNKKK